MAKGQGGRVRGSPVLPGWGKDTTGHNSCRHGRGGGTKRNCKLRNAGDFGCPSSAQCTGSGSVLLSGNLTLLGWLFHSSWASPTSRLPVLQARLRALAPPFQEQKRGTLSLHSHHEACSSRAARGRPPATHPGARGQGHAGAEEQQH